MKKTILYFTAISLVLLVGACKEEKSPLTFSVDNTNISVSEAESYAGFVIHTLDTWTVSKPSDADWLSFISPSSGKYSQKVVLKAEQNFTFTARSATLTVSCEGQMQNVVIAQDPLQLVVGTTDLSAGFSDETLSVSILSAGQYTAVPNVPWITVTTQTDALLIHVAYNSGVARTGAVVVSYGSVTKTIVVAQEAWRLRYQDFLGTYTMSYATGNAEPPNRNRSITVTLSQATDGVSYYLKGILSAADEARGNILVFFTSKGIEIRGQLLFVRAETNYDFWLLPLGLNADGGLISSFASSASLGMETTDLDVSTGMTFSMSDMGTWGTSRCIGFRLRNYTGSTAVSPDVAGENGDTTYLFPFFEKQ